MNNPARELARFAVETSLKDLPPAVVHETKLVIMDSIGCALAALSNEKGKMYASLVKRYGGPPEATIIGTGERGAMATAALINGELMFTLDYCSVMAGGHDSTYVLPAPLAFAEGAGASGKELILAAALGFEISSRLARAVLAHPLSVAAMLPRRAGTTRSGNAHSNLGAAAAAGKLMKFDLDKMNHAMGIAGHLCMVLTKPRWGAGGYHHMSKYGMPGWQITGAIMAVLLADEGYLGDTTVLDADNGFAFFTGYADWHPEYLLDDIGKTWWFTHRLHYKPYPCCGAFHAAIDCFYDVTEQNNLKSDEIESVRLFMGSGAQARLLTSKELENPSAAQFNPPYVVAVAAHRVKIGPEWYDTTTVRDPRILKFMEKVTCCPHPGYKQDLAKDPLSALAKCEVTARGQVFTVERNHRRGTIGTESAPTEDDLVRKFRHNAERILTQDKIDRAVKMFLDLDRIDDISRLMREVTQ
jgi:2-methylcitrate dehydratase PrpD